jgi:hypothetical protein
MPNLYATVDELKETNRDAIQTATTKYDENLYRLADQTSRLIDVYCRRVFFPRLGTYFFNGEAESQLWIPELVSVTSVSFSIDNGQNYTALTSSDYILTVSGDWNSQKSYNRIDIDVNSTALSAWPRGQKSVKIVGVWGYADDRDTAWQDTLDEVEDAPLTAAALLLTVNDVNGVNQYGVTPRISWGSLLRAEDEYLEVTAAPDTGNNTAVIARAANGTTAAEHVQDIQLDIWLPPKPIKDAMMIQAIKTFQRGAQGMGDARTLPDGGQMFYLKELDPEAQMKLSAYRKTAVG